MFTGRLKFDFTQVYGLEILIIIISPDSGFGLVACPLQTPCERDNSNTNAKNFNKQQIFSYP